MTKKNEVDLADEHNILVEMLIYINNICVENNIKYSLSGGTLLGAIRHKGIIPWDDDVDIMLTRENYERLKNILVKKNKYGIIADDTIGSFYCYMKIFDQRTSMLYRNLTEKELNDLGVFIDIFPIDTVPADYDSRLNYLNVIENLNNKMCYSIPGYYYYNDSPFKSVLKKIIRYPRYKKFVTEGLTSYYWREKLLEKMKEDFSQSDSTKSGFLLSQYHENEFVSSEVFQSYDFYDFEGLKLMGIKDYDSYLSSLYGDYMKLPPKNQRVLKHSKYSPIWKGEEIK